MAAAVAAPLTNQQKFPELYDLRYEDPMLRKRTVPMEVIVIGMMRTGTTSLYEAFKILGYGDPYHMMTCMQYPRDSELWKKAADAKFHGKGKPFTREDWDHLLGHHRVCLDTPSAAFMPELIAAYPEAKVIVAERDPDKWIASLNTTLRASFTAISGVSMVTVLLFDRAFFAKWLPMIGSIMTGMFGPKGVMSDDEDMKRAYRAMHEEVRQLVPEERRLEFRLEDGWDGLCQFLGKDIPHGVKFPHANDSKNFVERFQVTVDLAKERAWKKMLPVFAGAGAAVAATYGLWSMRRR